MANQAKSTEWKTHQSSSTSSAEGHSPDDKKIKHHTSHSDSVTSTISDEVATALNMVDLVMPKLELLLEKVVAVELKLEKLKDVKWVNDEMSSLQVKIDCFETRRRRLWSLMKR